MTVRYRPGGSRIFPYLDHLAHQASRFAHRGLEPRPRGRPPPSLPAHRSRRACPPFLDGGLAPRARLAAATSLRRSCARPAALESRDMRDLDYVERVAILCNSAASRFCRSLLDPGGEVGQLVFGLVNRGGGLLWGLGH